MERLFSPCTRYRDLVENQQADRGGFIGRLRGPLGYGRMQETNLDASLDEFLSAERGFTYVDLYTMLRIENTLAWLTPHAAVARVSGSWWELDRPCRFRFIAEGKEIYALARSPEQLLEICDVVLRLLAASVVHSVILDNWNDRDDVLINAGSLAYLLEQCQSLKVLTLMDLEMDENHCRVLGAYSRPGLGVELKGCTITGSGAIFLVEVLGRNRGPTSLERCEIDNILADGLRGNSRLKSFKQDFSENSSVSNREVVAIECAVQENKGLVVLELRSYNFNMNDETWGAVCDSLKTHPTLEVLDLCWEPPQVPDVITSRTQALVDMIKVNTSIHTLRVNVCYSEHEIYRESVVPYLETNRLRSRLLAIQKTRPIAYRAKLLGRALLATRTDPNRFWMLLSGNAEVAFPSRTTTIAEAASLPMPASTTATSTLTTTATVSLLTAAVAAATRAVIPPSASASDAFASTPTAATAANVPTPSAGQKRKASP
jgi:hypothetical protein